VSANFAKEVAALPMATSVGIAVITRLVKATEVVQTMKAKRRNA
jgi:hypothetical protein